MRILALALAVAAAVAPEGLGTPARGSPQSERAVVWAVGDAATPLPAARRVAGAIRNARPDRFLYLGDVYEYGTATEFRRSYDPLYGTLAGITEPTPGNHEWGNRFSGYYPYWRAKKGRMQPPWSSGDGGLGAAQPELAGGPWSRLAAAPLARAGLAAGATAASPSGTGRVSAPGSCMATRPTSRRSGTRSGAAQGRC